MVIFWIVIAIVATLGASALVYLGLKLLHRWLLKLEERGYINYTKQSGSCSGGLFELDKLTQPSVEHVQKAMDSVKESVENDGE